MDLTISDSVMQQRLTELQAASGKDMSVIVREESKLFLKQVIQFTPPPGLGSDAKKQGENAVKMDIMKLFTPVSQEFLDYVGQRFGGSNVDGWITGKDGKRIDLKWQQLDPSGAGMSNFHTANRDRRGRVLRKKLGSIMGVWKSRYVVTYAALADYIEKKQANVGLRKAGWSESYMKLSGTVQRWIGRHQGANGGQIQDKSNDPNPSITMINRAPGLSGDAHIIHSAMDNRKESIRRKVKMMFNNYGKGMKEGKITPQA